MKTFIKKTALLFIIAAIIVLVDQFTKWLVVSNLEPGETWVPWVWLAPYARIVHWWNTGVAFGMLQGMNLVFVILAILVSMGIVYYYTLVPEDDKWLRAALIMELGGAVGNLVDRIRLGHVIDFVSVGNFPVWNVADSCITVGVFVLLIGVWLQERRQKRAVQPSLVETSDLSDGPLS